MPRISADAIVVQGLISLDEFYRLAAMLTEVESLKEELDISAAKPPCALILLQSPPRRFFAFHREGEQGVSIGHAVLPASSFWVLPRLLTSNRDCCAALSRGRRRHMSVSGRCRASRGMSAAGAHRRPPLARRAPGPPGLPTSPAPPPARPPPPVTIWVACRRLTRVAGKTTAPRLPTAPRRASAAGGRRSSRATARSAAICRTLHCAAPPRAAQNPPTVCCC